MLGVGIGSSYKAYPAEVLANKRVVNDTVGDTPIVVIGLSISQAASTYERGGR